MNIAAGAAGALARWEDEGGAPSSQELPADALQSQRALVACRQELAAALQQIDLLNQEIHLSKDKVALLTRDAAAASEFAYRDGLTGLPNRRLLLDRFTQAVERAKRQRHQVVLLFLDLDRFKQINDSLGHTAGDVVLQQVAARLTACIRSSDTACRYGGDEFVVVLPEFKSRNYVTTTTEKIRTLIAMPYVVDDTAIKLTASVGAAVYPVDGNKLDDLIRASDRAMYRSKALSAISSTSFNTPHGDRAVNTDTGQQWQLDRVPRAT